MDVQNPQNKDDVVSVKNCKVNTTDYTEVFAQVVTINGKIYAGVERKSYYEDKNNQKLKSIFIQIEAWTTFMTQAVPNLEKAIKEQEAKEPAPS